MIFKIMIASFPLFIYLFPTFFIKNSNNNYLLFKKQNHLNSYFQKFFPSLALSYSYCDNRNLFLKFKVQILNLNIRKDN